MLRLLTWNANQAFAGKKACTLFAYEPDLAIVQECAEADAALAAEVHGFRHFWFGHRDLLPSYAERRPGVRARHGSTVSGYRRSKGIAVFVREPWQATVLAEPEHRWIIAFRIAGPECFTLVAVWSWAAPGIARAYVDRVRLALEQNASWFTTDTVVAGDLNSNASWDGQTNDGHTGLVRFLARRRLASVYHHTAGEAHGQELNPTFHLYKREDRGHHIDYIFLPQSWLGRVRYFELGGSEWLRLSDHRPLFVELEDALAAEDVV